MVRAMRRHESPRLSALRFGSRSRGEFRKSAADGVASARSAGRIESAHFCENHRLAWDSCLRADRTRANAEAGLDFRQAVRAKHGRAVPETDYGGVSHCKTAPWARVGRL